MGERPYGSREQGGGHHRAGSGIGEATVRVFLEAGARVVAVDLNPELTRTHGDADRSVLRCVVGDLADEATALLCHSLIFG